MLDNETLQAGVMTPEELRAAYRHLAPRWTYAPYTSDCATWCLTSPAGESYLLCRGDLIDALVRLLNADTLDAQEEALRPYRNEWLDEEDDPGIRDTDFFSFSAANRR